MFWPLVFILAFFLEAWHDGWRAKNLEKNCHHDFKKSRLGKIIKGICWTVAVAAIAYRENNFWLILIYWGEKNILFHPFYRIFVNGWKFVFSWEGLTYMIRHSEIWYYYKILFKNNR